MQKISRGCFGLPVVMYWNYHPTVNLYQLLVRWRVGLLTVKETPQYVKQLGARLANESFNMIYWTKKHQFRYNRSTTTIYMDTLIADYKYLLGKTCGKIFTTRLGYLRFMLLRKKGDTYLALSEVLQEVGGTNGIHKDNERELNLFWCRDICEKHGCINTTTTKRNFMWHNKAYQWVKEAKRKSVRLIHEKGEPRKLWDFGTVYVP